MEQTHAVVVMSEYLSMLEFIDNVNDENKIVMYNYNYPWEFYGDCDNKIKSWTFITKDELVIDLVEQNNDMSDKNHTLEKKNFYQEKEIERLKQFEPKIEIVDTPKELSIEDIKKMGYFEFRKWKNK